MAKAKKSKPRPAPSMPEVSKPIFDSPFKHLKKLVAVKTPVLATPPVAPAAPAPLPAATPTDEAALLREALLGVRPLAGPRRTPPPPERGTVPTVVSEDAEVLAELSDLVAGEREFDLTETDEYVEGARVGLDPRLIVRLRRGEFALEAHIDLHGMIQPAAHEALQTFILESVRKGRRMVLVVHGRGLGSPGGRPVLKHSTAQWLSHGYLSGYVLGFTTARAADGGAGALYVLLQRDRRRAPFDVLNGAKRRE